MARVSFPSEAASNDIAESIRFDRFVEMMDRGVGRRMLGLSSVRKRWGEALRARLYSRPKWRSQSPQAVSAHPRDDPLTKAVPAGAHPRRLQREVGA